MKTIHKKPQIIIELDDTTSIYDKVMTSKQTDIKIQLFASLLNHYKLSLHLKHRLK